MSGTVAKRLATELLADLDDATPPRSVLLWFDPDLEFARLLPAVAGSLGPDVELLRHGRESSQIDLKLHLLRREGNHSRTIVYAPERRATSLQASGPRGEGRPELWALADYRFKGVVWTGGGAADNQISLLHWLERQGVQPSFGDQVEKLVAGGGDSILARYVEMHASTDPERWPRPLRSDDVRKHLAGDPTDAALLLLVSPRAAESEWGERATEVLRGIAQEYGSTSDSSSLADQAQALVTSLALTDAWDAFGRRDDFPFASVIPSSENQRTRALGLLRDHVLKRTDVAPRYHAVVDTLSGKWSALGSWAKKLDGQPLGMRSVATQRVTDLLDALDLSTNASRTGAAAALRKAMASWQGAEEQWIPPMRATAASVRLLDGIARAAEPCAAMQDASLLVEAYSAADGWAALDAAYLRVQGLVVTEPTLAPLRDLVDHAYVDWIASANDRFTNLVEQVGEWPPAGTRLAPPPSWTATARHRLAVIVTDALRLDLARAVSERLADAKLEIGLTTLPTTTPFGMAALLPHGGELSASVTKTGIALRHDDSKQDLGTRLGRRTWLEEKLSSTRQSVAFVELDNLLAGVKGKVADLTVVLDYALDDRGHGEGSLPEYVEGHVSRLVRAVQRLHDLGIGTVEVATDHGFLHQPPDLVEALGKPPVSPAQVHHRALRYAVIKPGAPVDSLINLPSPLTPNLELGFPRGIRTLEKPVEYLHGGVSLQECVIGLIRSVRTLGPSLLPISVAVPTSELATGTVAIRIEPAAGEQMSLSPPPPRHVRLWLETTEGGTASDPLEVEVRWDGPAQTLALYLREGQTIAAGSQIRLVVDDSESGERLHAQDLTMLIDWE